MRYEVSAPPDILLLISNDLSECGKIASINASLSGEVILIIDTKTDTVVGIGVPPSVQVFIGPK